MFFIKIVRKDTCGKIYSTYNLNTCAFVDGAQLQLHVFPVVKWTYLKLSFIYTQTKVIVNGERVKKKKWQIISEKDLIKLHQVTQFAVLVVGLCEQIVFFFNYITFALLHT